MTHDVECLTLFDVRKKILVAVIEFIHLTLRLMCEKLILLANRASKTIGLWRGITLVISPMGGLLFGFISGDLVFGSLVYAVVSSLFFSALTAFGVYVILFKHTEDSILSKCQMTINDLSVTRKSLVELHVKEKLLRERARERKAQRLRAAAEAAAAVAAQKKFREAAEQTPANFTNLESLANREDEIRQQRMRLYRRNWRAMRSVEFEDYLEEVLRALGYHVETTPTSGDQGVDLIAMKLGVRIAIQVKGYVNSVGNAAIQQAFTGKVHYECQLCAVITNSLFTSSAEAIAQSTGCILIHENNFRDFVLGGIDLTMGLAQKQEQDSAGNPWFE